MKNIIFLTIFVSLAFSSKAQKITIDLDSISDNKVFVQSYKWKKSTDTVQVIEYKVNGIFYDLGNGGFNFNMTFEGKLDGTSGFISKIQRIAEEKEKEVRELEAKLLKIYNKNPEIDQKLKKYPAKNSAQPQGFKMDIPKNYDVIDKPKTEVSNTTPKRKWWKIKK